MEIGIIGAGVAGLGAALELDGADVTLLEKSGRVGGRAATRRDDGCTYDHGANYITPDEETERLIEDLDTEGLIDIEKPVWTFDSGGEIGEGDDRDRRALTYENGIDQFADRVFTRTDATLETDTRIEELDRDDGRWRVRDTDGEDYGFDALVATPPAPRTAALLRNADRDDPLRDDLAAAIADVPYRTIVSAVLHYPFELDWPYYALVNTDKDHAVGWVSREEEKPGHVPNGECLLIAQMAPEWSLERYREPDDTVAAEAAGLVADLIGDERLADPDWTDLQRWRHALPDGSVDDEVLTPAAEHDLFFAGDWVAGEGRVGAAFENGRAVGRRIESD